MKREREERCKLGRSDEVEVGVAAEGKTEVSSSDKGTLNRTGEKRRKGG